MVVVSDDDDEDTDDEAVVETDKTVVVQVFAALGLECITAVIFLVVVHFMTVGRAAQHAAEKKAKRDGEPDAFFAMDKELEGQEQEQEEERK